MEGFDIFKVKKNNKETGAEVGHRDGINIPEGPASIDFLGCPLFIRTRYDSGGIVGVT